MPTITFLWNPINDNIIREMDGAGTVLVEYTTEPNLYGDIMSQRCDGQVRYFHYDGTGSTIAVTDGNGNVTDTRAYTAFGERTESTGSAEYAVQFVGQKGYYTDTATNSVEIRHRSYLPALSRWTAADPLRRLSALVNPYCYVLNCPVTLIDPSGLRARVCKPSLVDKHNYDISGPYYTDLDIITDFGEPYHDWAWGYMEHDGYLIAGAKFDDSTINIYGSVSGELWAVHDVFLTRLWRWASAKGRADATCTISCVTKSGCECVAVASCKENNKSRKLGKYWAVSYKYLIEYNGPVVTVQYGAKAAFSYSSPDIEINLGGDWVGASVVLPGGSFEFEASKDGAVSWKCECTPKPREF